MKLDTIPAYVVGNAPAGVPQTCPITGLPFFTLERNPDGEGYVPTYGGPFTSYTLAEPSKDSESGYQWQEYNHDAGDWGDVWDVPKAEVLIRPLSPKEEKPDA